MLTHFWVALRGAALRRGDRPLKDDGLSYKGFHFAGGATGAAASAGLVDAGVAASAAFGAGIGGVAISGVVLPLKGTGMPRRCFLRLECAATSSLVVVSGFRVAGSFQVVSLPGAAPLST